MPINELSRLGTVNPKPTNLSEPEPTEEPIDKPEESFPYNANTKKLPELSSFRVQYSHTFATLCNAPWIIFVLCKKYGSGFRLASDVAQDFNMRINESFKTKAEAKRFGEQYVSTWGK